jgi:hypothetical protein
MRIRFVLAALLASGCSSSPTSPSVLPDASTFQVGPIMPKPCDWKTGFQFASVPATGYDVVDPGPDEVESPGHWNPQVHVDATVRWLNVVVPTEITLKIRFRDDDPGQGVGMLPTYGGTCDNVEGISEIHWSGFLKEQRYDAGARYFLDPTPMNPKSAD